jgi:hypothetical protein
MSFAKNDHLQLLYRGSLASCNYDCGYCPFAKKTDAPDAVKRDTEQLNRFVDWCASAPHTLEVLFTPWGEALVRKCYAQALVKLSRLAHIERVGIQTNLSAGLNWLAEVNVSKLSLWCTYHPSEISRTRFLARVAELAAAGVRYSVGMVGVREDLPEVIAMRQVLPASVYLWINALDPRPTDYYSVQQIDQLTVIDPHFAFQQKPSASLGANCRAGLQALSINGDGDVKPCHFLARNVGNLYDGSYLIKREKLACTNAICDCYIGYALRDDLPFVAPLHRGWAPVVKS